MSHSSARTSFSHQFRGGTAFVENSATNQKEPTNRPQTNSLVETPTVKNRSIQLRHPAASTRIRSAIGFVSVSVLVGLMVFLSRAHSQVATPNPIATPLPTATPFPTLAPLITPRP